MIRWIRLQFFVWRNGLSWFQRRKKISPAGTTIYVGLPGSGKSLMLVKDAIEKMRSGVAVYSNIRIVDRVTGLAAGKCGSWLEMLEISVSHLEAGEACYFAIDELHLFCDARSWARTPAWWLSIIAQRRHLGIGIGGTTQAFSQLDKRFRTLVDFVISCRMPFGSLPVIRTREYMPGLVDDSDQYRSGEVGQVWFEYVPWWVYSGYSTYELVLADDWSDLSDDEATELAKVLSRRAQFAAKGLSDDMVCFELPIDSLDDRFSDAADLDSA